jgi:hypothetical protein
MCPNPLLNRTLRGYLPIELVGYAVLMHESPLAVDQQCLEIIVWVASFVSRRSVADFEVHEAVTVACARLEARTHSWRELSSTFVGMECWPTVEDVDKLVLLGVSMTKGRNCVRSQAGEVYAKVFETKLITQLALFSPDHTRCKRLRIDRRFASGRNFGCCDGDWNWLIWHGASQREKTRANVSLSRRF